MKRSQICLKDGNFSWFSWQQSSWHCHNHSLSLRRVFPALYASALMTCSTISTPVYFTSRDDCSATCYPLAPALLGRAREVFWKGSQKRSSRLWQRAGESQWQRACSSLKDSRKLSTFSAAWESLLRGKTWMKPKLAVQAASPQAASNMDVASSLGGQGKVFLTNSGWHVWVKTLLYTREHPAKAG